MDKRYMKMGMQILDISSLISMKNSIDVLIYNAAERLVEDGITARDKSWIKDTQGKHAEPILAVIKQVEKRNG